MPINRRNPIEQTVNLKFFLITENVLHASYLVDEWSRRFVDSEQFGGILIRDTFDQSRIDTRRQLHQSMRTKESFSETDLATIDEAYSGISDAERAMVKLYGITSVSADSNTKTTFLGKDLNADPVKRWFDRNTNENQPVLLFVFLDQLLKPWWINRAKYIVNAHSAVLPFARGMYAIENIACLKNADDFAKVAGATVHYVNEGVDTGPIIRATRMKDPFIYDSLWEVKAVCYKLAFQLLIATAEMMIAEPLHEHVGTVCEPEFLGPAFKGKDFTHTRRRQAEDAFLHMKLHEGGQMTQL